MVAWGAHDPGLDRAASAPSTLLREMERKVGRYPGERWLYGTPWASPVDTRQMGADLVAGVEARSRAAQWLLAERFDDWDLGVVVVSEPHSAAEGLWHGIDPTHPLHDVASAPIAGDALTDVYRATDRLVGELIAATDPSTVIVFSMGGMGPNRSDAASMVLLPELLLRWSLGEERLAVPDDWSRAPEHVPLEDDADVGWSRESFRGVPPGPQEPPRSLASRVGALLPAADAGTAAREASGAAHRHLPLGYRDPQLGNPPRGTPTGGRRCAPFAIPSFYDGRIRVNLRGREADGIVDLADHERVCDELEVLLRACVDPRTGASVVESIERPEGDDPRGLDSTHADLVGRVGGLPARVAASDVRDHRTGAVPPHRWAHESLRLPVDHRARRRARRPRDRVGARRRAHDLRAPRRTPTGGDLGDEPPRRDRRALNRTRAGREGSDRARG